MTQAIKRTVRKVYDNFINFPYKFRLRGRKVNCEVEMNYLTNRSEGYFEDTAIIVQPLEPVPKRHIRELYRKLSLGRYRRRLKFRGRYYAEKRTRHLLGMGPI